MVDRNAGTWFVDASAGKDENDGRYTSSALATLAELGRRMMPECPECRRTDCEEGHRAGCLTCTARSVMET